MINKYFVDKKMYMFTKLVFSKNICVAIFEYLIGKIIIENFLSEINKLLDKYMPLKKISNREFKRTYKPWITDGILIL